MTVRATLGRASRSAGAPRRVLYVPVLFYPEPWNGIMEHLRVLIRSLDRVRFEPLLGTRTDDGTQTSTLSQRANVDTIDLGASRSVGGLWRAFRNSRPDIVHVHTPSTSGLTKLALAARLARVPKVVLTLHQVAPDRLPWRSRAVNRGGHYLINTTVAVSADAADTQATGAGLRRRRIRIVPNGVEDVAADVATDGLLPRQNGDVWAGYFGRLAEEKGVDTLIDAVARARHEGADLRLLIAGEGYEREALESRARTAGCADAVLFTGYRADARALMRAVDIVVHPPRFEGFGLVVAEAMAAGRPVVATDVAGGIPEMVRDGHTGMLVPYADVEALATALQRLCGDESLRSKLGRAGRARYAQEFTVERMIERTIALY
jgi:glycosyltransferase involved in cell wall biosynthesis